MDGSDPHFDVGSIATHNMSWDLEKVDVQADPKVESGKADTARERLIMGMAHGEMV